MEQKPKLDDVCTRMQTLKDRLSEVLHQDSVQGTLRDITTRLPLLDANSYTAE
jgi:hypothetical protein